jgi:serine/threonine protein kinase
MVRYLQEISRTDQVESENGENRRESIALVVIVVMASLAVVALLVAFSYYWYIKNKVRKRFNTEKSLPPSNELVPTVMNSSSQTEAQVFTFKQLQAATSNFSSNNVIGNGGFGSVYKGVMQDGSKVAIKQLDQASKQGEQEFRVEVDVLSCLHSPYLLALIGYCADHDHRLLVYEFMPNGSLQEHLYSDGSPSNPPKLDWETRMRIALDAARGLEYLHECIDPPVIHRDFKSSNILLDRNYHAKVSDFGLAKLGSDKVGGHVSTRVLGTQGYVAPEYALTGHLTTKSDVYSYGVVLLELLTGRVPVDMKRPPGQGVLVSWALPQLTDREKLVQIIDPVLEGQFSMKELIQVAAIAAMCVQPEADYRPLMADVVQSLVPLVKHHRPSSRVVSTPNLHHNIVTLKSSSMDSGSSSAAND